MNHRIADALASRDARIEDSRETPTKAYGRREPFPKAWETLINSLGAYLGGTDAGTAGDAAPRAATAAHDAAQRVVRVYHSLTPRGGADAALWRFARMAALAAAYIGWSLASG